MVFLQWLGVWSGCQALPEDERLVRWHRLALLRRSWETDLQERLSVRSPVTKNGNGVKCVSKRTFSKAEARPCLCSGSVPRWNVHLYRPTPGVRCGLLLLLHFINPHSSGDWWFSTRCLAWCGGSFFSVSFLFPKDSTLSDFVHLAVGLSPPRTN